MVLHCWEFSLTWSLNEATPQKFPLIVNVVGAQLCSGYTRVAVSLVYQVSWMALFGGGGGGGGSTRPCISWIATVKFGVRTAHSGIRGYWCILLISLPPPTFQCFCLVLQKAYMEV